MSESSSSKVKWIVVGAVIGTVISLLAEYWIKPLLAAKPNIEVLASRERHGEASFSIANTGKAAATDVVVTLWATAPFAARTDITKVEHAGGAADSQCEAGISIKLV